MNLTDPSRARTLALVLPQGQAASGWRGYAVKATVIVIGLSTYILFFRKGDFLAGGGRWRFRRSKGDKTEKKEDAGASFKESRERPVLVYNREVCPICLGAPKIGVRAPCGHLLCADCLASYCDVRLAPVPPPCPLCRAPLDSVALTCDLAILSAEMTPANIDGGIRAWIQQYNLHRGLPPGRHRVCGLLRRRFVLFVNLLALVLVVGLIAARLQILPWNEYTSLGPIVDITLGIALMTCVWFKCQEQATMRHE